MSHICTTTPSGQEIPGASTIICQQTIVFLAVHWLSVDIISFQSKSLPIHQLNCCRVCNCNDRFDGYYPVAVLDRAMDATKTAEISGARIFPRRYLVLILCFLGLFHMNLLQANLSVAIVAMTSNYSFTDINGTVTYVSRIVE